MTTAAPSGVSIAENSRQSPGYGLISCYLFVVYGTVALGMGLVPALITTFREDYGLSGGQLANIQNLKDIGLIAAMFAGPVLLRRLGVARMTTLAISVGLAGCVILITARNPAAVLTGAFMHGATFSLGTLAAVSYLYRLPKRYHRISALYATFGVASFTAPAMVGALVPADGDYRVVYAIFAAALAVLVAAGTVLNRSAGKSVTQQADQAVQPRLSRAMLGGWLTNIVVFATLMAGETVVVSWVTSLGQYRYGLSLPDASFLLALLWVAYTPARAVGDLLVKRLSITTIMVMGAALVIIGNILICAGSVAMAYAGVVVFAFGTAPLIPVYQGWLLSRTPAEQHGPLNASLGVGSAVVTTVMVWLTGLTVDVDARLPFAVSTGCLAIVVALVVRTRNA
ncbi:MFS transporter [Amycolatopsis pithecellobii]|uniref:MFS transporter n=1 Tax=Amycolatopsis pithecellobii TaxID=664692 RepID=A0A6N7Z5C4_9PSEU|nr:MFS transporter [Amycolatopsis pithecellobii]MTD55754.1 MFS transporter [Amycolatopsis pithecellobii]